MRILSLVVVLLVALVKPIAAGAADYIKVEIQGTLNSEVFAIGGETTGVVISANGVTWELELGADKQLRKLAAELHQKSVVATGELTIKQGVEIRQRSIVKVDSLKAAGGDSDGEKSYLSPDGELLHAITVKDAQGGFAGFSGHLWTIDPDGAFRRAPFLNDSVRKADLTGTFSKEELAKLATQLATLDLIGLPKQIGKNTVGANPHVITITFGKASSSLTLNPGVELPEADPKDVKSEQSRFAKIVQLLLRGMKTRADDK